MQYRSPCCCGPQGRERHSPSQVGPSGTDYTCSTPQPLLRFPLFPLVAFLARPFLHPCSVCVWSCPVHCRYEDRGLIPRTLSFVFSEVAKSKEWNTKVFVSYMEIYNDKGYGKCGTYGSPYAFRACLFFLHNAHALTANIWASFLCGLSQICSIRTATTLGSWRICSRYSAALVAASSFSFLSDAIIDHCHDGARNGRGGACACVSAGDHDG